MTINTIEIDKNKIDNEIEMCIKYGEEYNIKHKGKNRKEERNQMVFPYLFFFFFSLQKTLSQKLKTNSLSFSPNE